MPAGTRSLYLTGPSKFDVGRLVPRVSDHEAPVDNHVIQSGSVGSIEDVTSDLLAIKAIGLEGQAEPQFQQGYVFCALHKRWRAVPGNVTNWPPDQKPLLDHPGLPQEVAANS